MTSRRKSKKRPCRICRKWYLPNPRVAERQKTCGAEICKRKWHAKKCEEWNKKHPSYFSEIYLSKKLAVGEVDIKTLIIKIIISAKTVMLSQPSLTPPFSRNYPGN